MTAGFVPLARFHLRVGTRLALRAAAPLAGLPLAMVLLDHDPAGALRLLASWLLGPSGGTAAGLALGALSLALAGWAAPRVSSGLGGWPRHLPITATVHRRAALAALAAAQAPIGAGLLLLAPAAARQAGGILPGRIAALPVSMAAAALAAWPGTHPWRSRPLAWAALLLAATAELTLIPLALALALAAELLAGSLAGPRTATRRPSPLPLPLLLAGRALGPAALGAVVASLAPVAAMTLLRVNNELSPALAAGAARFGAGMGVIVLLSALAERLAQRRPVWPWSRSLPVSAVRRIGEDAALLALPCLVPLVAAACLDLLAALTVAACLPCLALLAAGALRPSARTPTGVAAGPLVGGALLAAWVTILPGLALLALASAPLAWRAAAEWDRTQKVSRWDELHHRAVGDPLSWSAR